MTENRKQAKVPENNPYLFIRLLTSVFCFLCFSTRFAYACPLCKEAVSKLGEIWTGLGFNWSIMFMLLVPFSLVGGFTLALYLQAKRARSDAQ